jgi:hypothetical protein
MNSSNYCCRAKRWQPPILDNVYSFYSCQIPARLMYFSQSIWDLFVVRSFVRSFRSHFLTSQNSNDVVYKFIYAGSLRWQSDHFRKVRSVRRSFIGAMTFNFDMTIWAIWHVAYFSIILQYYYLILEENNYMFEGMLIKIVIWSFEYFYLYM